MAPPIEDDVLARISPAWRAGPATTISVEETARQGAGVVEFSSNWRCLCIRVPEQPIVWLADRSAPDAIILEFRPSGVWVHLVEMKSTMTPGVYVNKCRKQIAAGWLNTLALLAVLDRNCCDVAGVTVHIAYTSESGVAENSITGRGSTGIRDYRSEWRNNRMSIPGLSRPVPIRRIVRGGDGNARAEL